MRRTSLVGWENVHKRYLVHVAVHNLGVLIRALLGVGTPKEAAAIRNAFKFVIQTAETIVIVIVASFDGDVAPKPPDRISTSSPGWQHFATLLQQEDLKFAPTEKRRNSCLSKFRS